MSTQNPITLALARERLAQGFNTLPIIEGASDERENKRPAVSSWKRWQTERQDDAFMTATYTRPRQAFALITGSVSGNVVCFDFDCDGAAYAPFMGKLPEALRTRLVVESSRSGRGRHIYLRLAHAPGGSEVFARAANGHPLIETRAQGGYVIAAPSVGQSLLQGSFDAVPTLTDADYALMVAAARSLDESQPPAANQQPTTTSQSPLTRPGDLFNRDGMTYFTGAIQTLGWQRVGGTDTAQQWRRPAKTTGSCSATLRLMDDGVWSWYTFTTSTTLPANRGLNIFSAFAKLFYNDDFGAAAKHLAAEGFCEAPPPSTLSPQLSTLNSQPSTQQEKIPLSTSTASLLPRLPRTGLIGRIADYTDAVSPRRNPTLSFAGALAFVAHAAGMAHYRSPYGDRPNLYLATLAPSTIGKSFPLVTNRRLAHALGINASVIGQIASGPGLEDAAAASPRALLVHLDEFQKLLGQMNAHDSGSALALGLVSTLLQLYGASKDVYAMRKMSQRGQRQKNPPAEFLDEPHVTVAAFGIAEFVFQHLSVESLADGLLGRFLVFIEDKRGPRVEEPAEESIPEEIMKDVYYLCHRHECDTRTSMFPTSIDPSRDKPVVRFTADAAARRKELQREEDRLYAAVAAGADGEGRRAIIGRTFEKAMKLSLVLAVSDNPNAPSISLDNVENGWALARASTDTLLALAENYTARNRYDELNKRVKRICREYGRQGRVSRSTIVRHMHEVAKDVDEVLATMQQAGEIGIAQEPTSGRPATVITLLPQAA